jgi:type IV fimbrial biogenesis protein FimT
MRAAAIAQRHARRRRQTSGLTLIELMVVVAVVAVLLMVAAPSMRDFIETQRHKSVHAELATDLQFARSEAVSRSDWLFLQFGVRANGSSCYTLYTCSAADAGSPAPLGCVCNCGSLPCASDIQEQRTVVAELARGVTILPDTPDVMLRFDPQTGGMRGFEISPAGGAAFFDQVAIDTKLDRRDTRLRAVVTSTGRVSTCSPGGAVSGYPSC